MPYLGLMTNGIGMITTIKEMKLRRHLEAVEKQISDKKGAIWDAIHSGASGLPANAEFHFKILDRGYGLVETKTNTLFQLSW